MTLYEVKAALEEHGYDLQAHQFAELYGVDTKIKLKKQFGSWNRMVGLAKALEVELVDEEDADS